MTIYDYFVTDPTDILIKINTINACIDDDPEINSIRLSTVYNAPDITITFETPLSDIARRILYCILVSVIDNNASGVDFEFSNNIGITRNIIDTNVVPSNIYDIYSGFNTGSLIYRSGDNNLYCCLSAVPDNANWILINGTGNT